MGRAIKSKAEHAKTVIQYVYLFYVYLCVYYIIYVSISTNKFKIFFYTINDNTTIQQYYTQLQLHTPFTYNYTCHSSTTSIGIILIISCQSFRSRISDDISIIITIYITNDRISCTSSHYPLNWSFYMSS